MKAAVPTFVVLAIALAGCNLAGDLTPPPALATAQAAETRPPATVSPTETAQAAATRVSATAISAEPGTIRGVVTNGTLGVPAPKGVEVMLSGFDGEQETYHQSTVVGIDGTYVFTEVPPVEGRVYGVAVTYSDVIYYSDGTPLTGDNTSAELPVTVYETTTDGAALSIERLHVLFNFSVPDQVQVIELWILSNSGERTVVAAPERGVIEVWLPEGASDLAFEDSSTAERFIQTAAGFGETAPIVPGMGTSQFIFSYWLPYGGNLAFQRPSDHPVSAVVVLLPPNGVTAQGAGLQDLGVQQVAGQSVQAYEGGPIPAGQALEIELRGKPQGESSTTGGGWINTAIGLGVLAVLLTVVGLWWFRPRLNRARAGDTTETLLDAIADLDDALDAGRIGADEHRRRREALKQQLRERMG